MKYRYRIWCHDCLGEDPQGCFDGGTELSEELFDAPEQAVEAGEKATKGVPLYEYEVTDEEGARIDEARQEEAWQVIMGIRNLNR